MHSGTAHSRGGTGSLSHAATSRNSIGSSGGSSAPICGTSLRYGGGSSREMRSASTLARDACILRVKSSMAGVPFIKEGICLLSGPPHGGLPIMLRVKREALYAAIDLAGLTFTQLSKSPNVVRLVERRRSLAAAVDQRLDHRPRRQPVAVQRGVCPVERNVVLEQPSQTRQLSIFDAPPISLFARFPEGLAHGMD